jgi:hypothetical protein
MKTIAQQLNIKEFPFIIKDDNGNQIYYENSTGSWVKQEYDSNRNCIYYEDFDGFWFKQEFDSNGNLIYFEESDGYIEDNRPKTVELTMDEIATKFGINVKDLKIKK